MSTTIWSGLNAGAIRYDLTYDAYRPDKYGTEVKINFHLHVYRQYSNTTFGYNIVWDSMWCAGTNRVSNREIKAASPNKFDFWVDSGEFSVWTSNNYVPGVRLIMTSPQNAAAGGSSGRYDTGTDIDISVPAQLSHTAPTAPTANANVSSIKPDGSFTLTWSGQSVGTYSKINHFCVDCRKYTASSNSWSGFTNIANLNSNYSTTYSSSTSSVNLQGRSLYSDLVVGDQLQFKVTMSVEGYGYATNGGVKTISTYKDGKVMLKGTDGTVREITRIKIKDTSGVIHDVQKVRVKDTSGAIHSIDLYWK